MVVINTTAQSKEKIQSVLEEGGGVAVLDFISKGNSTSIDLMPIAQQLNAEHEVPLIKIDADQCPELSKIFLVDMIPTFVVVKQNWNNPIHIMNCNTKDDVTKIFHTAVNNKEEMKAEEPMMM